MGTIAVPKESNIVGLDGKDLKTDVPENVAHELPKPCGYKILIALPEISETTGGGILKAKETIQVEEVGTIVGFVLSMGPDAYKDESKFPTGPYCSEGDFVIMRAYSGTRLKIHGREFRLINDQSVEAVVDSPYGVTKV
jgi:co-chaperonin GroES (HSP10)